MTTAPGCCIFLHSRVLFFFSSPTPYLVSFEVGADRRARGLQTVPRLWISLGALNDRDHSQMDWHAFFSVNYKIERRMLIPLQARSDTIRAAHIKAFRDMLALSTSFKLMLRAGCFVLIGLNKNQAN